MENIIKIVQSWIDNHPAKFLFLFGVFVGFFLGLLF